MTPSPARRLASRSTRVRSEPVWLQDNFDHGQGQHPSIQADRHECPQPTSARQGWRSSLAPLKMSLGTIWTIRTSRRRWIPLGVLRGHHFSKARLPSSTLSQCLISACCCEGCSQVEAHSRRLWCGSTIGRSGLLHGKSSSTLFSSLDALRPPGSLPCATPDEGGARAE